MSATVVILYVIALVSKINHFKHAQTAIEIGGISLVILMTIIVLRVIYKISNYLSKLFSKAL